jgi:hypothetical protein
MWMSVSPCPPSATRAAPPTRDNQILQFIFSRLSARQRCSLNYAVRWRWRSRDAGDVGSVQLLSGRGLGCLRTRHVSFNTCLNLIA